ncbi:MAG: FmdB family zinc ribbon protein [Chloroflexota bacterium]
MPTYDYQCRSCGNTIEVIHSMLADGPTACEICGGSLRRIIHPTGIIFKGAGFYKTDSRSSSGSDSSARSAPAKTPAADGSTKESGAGAGSGGTAGSGSDASSGDASSSKSESGSAAPKTAKPPGGTEAGKD